MYIRIFDADCLHGYGETLAILDVGITQTVVCISTLQGCGIGERTFIGVHVPGRLSGVACEHGAQQKKHEKIFFHNEYKDN
jgi:hypothetical protein